MEEMIEQPIFENIESKVYIKVNENNEIINVGSSIFIEDTTGWIEIDEGFGDTFAHAQSQYFEKPLRNEDGGYVYSYVDGKINLSEVCHEYN